jgi:tetratricopeptide (TPR) repeat protein
MATKKAAVTLKEKAVKNNRANGLRAVTSSNPTVAFRSDASASDTFPHPMQAYEQALKFLQAQKFEKAVPVLEKLIAGGPKELADRAAIHLNICRQQMSRVHTDFNSVEEHYDYAISLMNMGDFVTAREHLEEISRDNAKLDFVWYGLSILECLTGRTSESLQHLSEAIRLNGGLRFQARNDSDFKNMSDDPRFTELLYPESPLA